MGDIRISAQQIQTSETKPQAIDKSTFMGRVVSNLNSIKDKFETISHLFKSKIDDLKNLFSKNNDRTFAAKNIHEEKITSKGEEILGTREPIGFQRSFKNNPVYEYEKMPKNKGNEYQNFDPKESIFREQYSHESQEKYADPSRLTNDAPVRQEYSKPEAQEYTDVFQPLNNPQLRETYSQPEKYADSSILQMSRIDTYSKPEEQKEAGKQEEVQRDIYTEPSLLNASPPVKHSENIIQKVSKYVSQVYKKIFEKNENIDLHKTDGQVRTYSYVKDLGGGAFKEAILVNKVKVAIDESGKFFQKVSQRVLLISDTTIQRQKSDIDVQAEIKVNSRLREIYKDGKKNGVDNLPHVAIAKPLNYQGEIVLSSKLMEGGSLDKQVKNLDDNQKKQVAKDMCKGLQELHQNGIVHRDIKLDNFLVDSKMNVKIADMGKAYLESDGAHRTGLFRPIIPTGLRDSPESWSKKDDIYQMGIALFQLFSGHDNINAMRSMMAPDLSAEERKDIDKVYQARDIGIENGSWAGIENINPPATRDFILKMLDKDPAKRPDIDEVVEFFER